MATSDNFFLSRRNLVGMLIAAAVIVVHLVAGLGFLWPVVALAGWGAGVALTPRPSQAELPAPVRPDADDLLGVLDTTAEQLYSAGPAPAVLDAMAVLRGSLLEVLMEWERLAGVPEQRVIVETMITEYLLAVVTGYLAVSDRTHPAAVGETTEALEILDGEARQIHQAVVSDTLRELEDHTRALRIQFRRPPGAGYDTYP